MIFKKHNDMDELDAKVEHLEERLDNLRDKIQEPSDELKSYIRKCVWESMQSWVDAGHQNVISTLNGQVVETKFIRNKVRELRDKRCSLELVLERIDEELEKFQGDLDG